MGGDYVIGAKRKSLISIKMIRTFLLQVCITLIHATDTTYLDNWRAQNADTMTVVEWGEAINAYSFRQTVATSGNADCTPECFKLCTANHNVDAAEIKVISCNLPFEVSIGSYTTRYSNDLRQFIFDSPNFELNWLTEYSVGWEYVQMCAYAVAKYAEENGYMSFNMRLRDFGAQTWFYTEQPTSQGSCDIHIPSSVSGDHVYTDGTGTRITSQARPLSDGQVALDGPGYNFYRSTAYTTSVVD